MKRRVVVTGLGAVTPIGNTVEEFWKGIRDGKVGIGPITRFDTTGYKVTLAAEVKDFKAADRMDFKAAKRMDRFSHYAVAASKEALEDSGLDLSKEDAFRAGVVIGSGIGSLEMMESEHEKILKGQVNRVNGSRKCFNSAWTSRKVHECRNSLCIWYTLHWRCISCNSV